MDQVQPNSSPNNKPKSPLYSAFIIEGAIIGVLILFIIITLQFFNILNVPFLGFIKSRPKEVSINQNQETVPIRKNGGTCKIVNPKSNVSVILPSASLSAELRAFSGVWEGKWNGSTKTVLIIKSINEKQAIVSYYFKSPPPSRYTFKVTPDGKSLITPNGDTTWTIDEGGFLVGIRSVGNQRSMASLAKCIPKRIK